MGGWMMKAGGIDQTKANSMGVCLVAAALVCTNAFAQGGNRPWEEYARHIGARTTEKSLSFDLLNEQVDLYTGRVSFKHTDVDLPGNDSLPVALSRTFAVDDPIVVDAYANVDVQARTDFSFADWELDVPRIKGVFAHKLRGPVLHSSGLDPNPNGINYTWSNQRCSGLRVPPTVGEFYPMDYWYGLSAEMPGGGELMAPASGTPSPTAGAGYRWVTTGLTWFSCLPSIQNGTGEGFLGIDSNGNKYWFNRMAAYRESTLERSFAFSFSAPPDSDFESVYDQYLDRRLFMLYATRVEDRFGNWVEYQYNNAANEPVRLNRILASDGRRIDITYGANGWITSASDGVRSWGYHYVGNRLERVTLPDSSQWRFDLGGSVRHVTTMYGEGATCNYPGYFGSGAGSFFEPRVLSVTHPSGAKGEFHVAMRLHGRSNVPKSCATSLADNTPEAAGSSDYVRVYWTNSLLKKRIVGVGVATSEWNYSYNDSHRPDQVRSARSQGYVPPGSWAPQPYTYTRIPEEGFPDTHISTYIVVNPTCISSSCAGRVSTDVVDSSGSRVRYIFGNSYRYNEGLLLSIERRSAGGALLESEELAYDLAQAGRPLPILFGITRQYRGDGINRAGLRPLRTRVLSRDGVRFSYSIDSYDGYGRPLRVSRSSAPLP